MNNFRHVTLIIIAFQLLAFATLSAFSQSTVQDFPTQVVSNEIAGIIKARDIGDARLTTYYYALNGEQGDLFINLVTHNFTGDIDVFTLSGLKPVTKIVVYADYGDVETGRAIYLRKFERMILRVQGRSPNDEAATFRLKFAGSFVASKAGSGDLELDLPRVSSESQGNVRVNSVGTLLPERPKPVETPQVKDRGKDGLSVAPEARTGERIVQPVVETSSVELKSSTEVVITDPTDSSAKTAEPPSRKPATASGRKAVAGKPRTKKVVEKEKPENVAEMPAIPAEAVAKPSKSVAPTRRRSAAKAPVEPKPDPMESVNLVIQFKNGDLLQRKMSEVFKFSVDKGILTVILKDGSISKYAILDVAKLTIE